MSKDTCANCHYFRSGEDGKRGSCRRSPPIAVLHEASMFAGWPGVGGEDWCGEWRPIVEVTTYPDTTRYMNLAGAIGGGNPHQEFKCENCGTHVSALTKLSRCPICEHIPKG